MKAAEIKIKLRPQAGNRMDAVGSVLESNRAPERRRNLNPKPKSETPYSRRKTARYHCTGGVELRRSENTPALWGTLRDISLEGCYVESSSTLPSGADVLFLMRAGEIQIRGRAHVKTSHHAVGMGLEFQHLATEDQQNLEFLIGTLAGGQEMQPEEKRTVVPADPPPPQLPPRLPTRPAHMASMTPTARPSVPPARSTGPPVRSAGPPARSATPTVPANANSAMAKGIMRAIGDLNELEQNLVKDRIDPRLIAQLHDAVEHVRQTAWTVQQWVELNATGGDPFEVLPQLEAERMHMLSKLAHNVTADIDASTINHYTLGISDLYETVQQLYRRLRKMLLDDAPES